MKAGDIKLDRSAKIYELINRNSLFLLLLLIIPTAIMASVLFLWPDVTWVAEVPYTAVEVLGSFVALLLAIFVLARYRMRPGILYFSAGLVALGITSGFLTVSAPHTSLYVWLNAFAGILGGILFILYIINNSPSHVIAHTTISTQKTIMVLGSVSFVALLSGILSVTLSALIPQSVQGGQFTATGWIINSIPTALLLFTGVTLFCQYRRTGNQESFLFTAIIIFLFQAVEALYFAEAWGIIWWLWQALRLAVYLVALVYVLKEHLKTSESLAIEVIERRRAEEALSKAEEDWRNSFNALDEVMLIINRDYSIERMNLTGLALFNQQGDALSGKKCYEVIRGKTQCCVDCPMKLALRRKKPHSVERYDESLGSYFSVKAAPILDGKHRVIKCAYVIRDITKEIKASEKEKALQQELNLTSRLASIGEVAAGIAHEINNPLTGVIGFAQMLADMEIPEQMREAVDVILDGARRTAGIVQKLLTFARHNKTVKEYVDINAVLKSTVDIRAYEMKNSNIEIITRLDADLPKTMANFGQIQQVFLNIIINAEQAIAMAHTQGKLTVTTEKVNDKIRASITDNGVGIPRENVNKLFDPFFTTKGDNGGTGLGLSISYGIIKEHNGKIKVKSQPGKGATFIIEMPIVAPSGNQVKETSKPVTKSIETSVADKKIIVIDDEPNICRVLYRLLSSAGYQVETISDAQSALNKLKEASYDLILLDIKMPGMNGIEFYERMQKIDPMLSQKVICITGDIISLQNKVFMEKTKLPCVTKPFSVDEIMSQVKSNLGGNK
ncbi:MAG: response regulator [Dehalococcoidales bacterium]|nr:response regulator [Dehalococcoidales bacterium]